MRMLTIFLSSLALLITVSAHAESPQKLRWISISSDSRSIVHEIIRSEVENREAYSTLAEDKGNQKAVEREKEVEYAEYKNSIIAAGKEFARAKKKRDDITSHFQASSTEFEESAKGIKNIRATIENLENQVTRYEQDKAAQGASLKKWLKSEKHGEVLVAVIYRRGFKDSVHELEKAADKASAPLIAQIMGSYLSSFTTIVNNTVVTDFISSTEQGSFKWNNEEPLRTELAKTERGTTYLRLKRYELYPFQENGTGKLKALTASTPNVEVAIINSREDLVSLLTRQGFSSNVIEPGRVDSLIKETALGNTAAEDGLREQVKTFQDRITALTGKIAAAKEEAETQRSLLRRKEDTYHKMSLDVAAIRERKDAAERQFQEAQTTLNEKKRNHESIIVKTAVASAKGSQTPAEASAEAILDKLAEVKNDAKTQHSTSTTEVTNFQLTSVGAVQSITEARIIAVRLISFLNEGDSVRVKMAFRVKTVLENEAPVAEADKAREKREPPEEHEAVRRQEEPKPEPSLPASEALQCLFKVRSIAFGEDGLHLLVDVKNTTTETRKVAFYDDSFGSWPRTRVADETGEYHDTTKAYVLRDGVKTLMVDIDSRGRGVRIMPQGAVTMELIFRNVPAAAKTVKINLHPFIYYQQGRSEEWEEFDFPMAYNFPERGRTPSDDAPLKVAATSNAAKGEERPPVALREEAKKTVSREAAFKLGNATLAATEANGCSFKLRQLGWAEDGLHLFVEITNTNSEMRKVALYDETFGSWTKSRIVDESGEHHETTRSYLLRDGGKTLLIDLDKKGRIEIPPRNSATVELVFQSVVKDTKPQKIHLHPFIYYKQMWIERWTDFDLPLSYTFPRKVALTETPVAKASEDADNAESAAPKRKARPIEATQQEKQARPKAKKKK